MEKIVFETFKDVSSGYFINQLKQEEPSNINFLSYRKYKVTIELIDEPKNLLIDRLKYLLEKTIGYNKIDRVKKEIEKINKNI